MRYEISCPKCRCGIVQTYKKVNLVQTMVITQCMNRKCNYRVAHLIPTDMIRNEEPTIATKLDYYGCVIAT